MMKQVFYQGKVWTVVNTKKWGQRLQFRVDELIDSENMTIQKILVDFHWQFIEPL